MASCLALEVKADKTVRRCKKPLMSEWRFDKKEFHAWFTLRMFYTKLRATLGLVVDERYAMPLSPYRDDLYTKEELAAHIDRQRRIKQAYHWMKSNAVRQGQINVISWTIAIVVTLSVFVFLVIALLIASGKIQL